MSATKYTSRSTRISLTFWYNALHIHISYLIGTHSLVRGAWYPRGQPKVGGERTCTYSIMHLMSATKYTSRSTRISLTFWYNALHIHISYLIGTHSLVRGAWYQIYGTELLELEWLATPIRNQYITASCEGDPMGRENVAYRALFTESTDEGNDCFLRHSVSRYVDNAD